MARMTRFILGNTIEICLQSNNSNDNGDSVDNHHQQHSHHHSTTSNNNLPAAGIVALSSSAQDISDGNDANHPDNHDHDNNNNKTDMAMIDLTNFTGRIIVTKAAATALQSGLVLQPVRIVGNTPLTMEPTTPPQRNSSRNNNSSNNNNVSSDSPPPFSQALGDPQDLIAAMSFAVPGLQSLTNQNQSHQSSSNQFPQNQGQSEEQPSNASSSHTLNDSNTTTTTTTTLAAAAPQNMTTNVENGSTSTSSSSKTGSGSSGSGSIITDDENDSKFFAALRQAGYVPEYELQRTNPDYEKVTGADLFHRVVLKVVQAMTDLDSEHGGHDGVGAENDDDVISTASPSRHRHFRLGRHLHSPTGRHHSKHGPNSHSLSEGAPWLKMEGRWGKLLTAAAFREKVSDRIREKRQQVRDLSTTHAEDQEYPTPLHRLCAEPNVTLDELKEALKAHPEAISMTDHRGRLPLHIIGDNDHLVSTKKGRQTATAFSWALMVAYPLGITTRDERKLMPFVAIIEDWVQYMYDRYRRRDKSDKNNLLKKHVIDIQKNIRNNNGKDGKRGTVYDNMKDKQEKIREYSQRALLDQIEIWDAVGWCFEMLSMAMDELGGKNGGLFKSRQQSLIHHSVKDTTSRNKLATHLCEQIPALFKTILMLQQGDGGENSNGPKRLLKMSIFRRCLLCPESVGPWLLNMLQSRSSNITTRAVDYLEIVSTTTVSDYLGPYRSVLPGDREAFHSLRSKVFEEINSLEGTIASLEVLDNQETERAAATAVVMNIFDKNLRRPFVVGLVLIDLVLHITLMLAFKRDVSFEGAKREDAIGSVPTQVVISISAHYFIRKWCEALSLLKLSPQIFKGYFSNIWTFFDFISIILVLSATTWNDKHPEQYRQGLNAFVLGLLWTKVLGFLKVVNKEMSTFILSLVQILGDLRYFMIVMAVVIFMFGDMMHIALSTKDNGQFCATEEDLSGPEEDFCSFLNMDSYLRVYSLLLGDFELDDYKRNDGIVVLFVIFTMMGVIILLNVLIAVISDSYERAKTKSSSLFGRARVTFIAQNEALESFLRPGADLTEGLEHINSNARRALVFGSRMFRTLVLVAIVITAMYAEVYLVTRAYGLIFVTQRELVTLVVVFSLAIVLTASLFVVVNFALEGVVANHAPRIVVKVFKRLNDGSHFFVSRFARRLFGLSDAIERGDHSSGEVEWETRLEFMQRIFEKSLAEAKSDIHDDIAGLEQRLNKTMTTSGKGADTEKPEDENKKDSPLVNFAGILKKLKDNAK